MVGGVLQNVGSEVSKELARATQKRDVLQARLDAATTSKQRATLSQQLAQANVEVGKLQLAVDKLNIKVGDLTNAVPAVAPTPLTPIFSTTAPPPFGGPDDVPTTMIISVVGLVFVGFPLALAFARLLWKRGNYTPPAPASQLPADSTRRFDQLEHAVDAIAIEVERISENQRYLTKLLSEPRPNVAVGAGRGGLPPAS